MKRALQLCSILACLGVSAFFVYSAHAVTIQSNERTAAPTLCYAGSNEQVGVCSGANITGTIYQKVEFPLNQSKGVITINSIQVHNVHNETPPQADDILFSELRNANNTVIATSNNLTAGSLAEGWLTLTFPGGYTFNTQSATTSIPSYISFTRQCSGSCGAAVSYGLTPPQYGTPYYSNFTATTTGGFPTFYPAYDDGVEALTNNRQLEFRINEASPSVLTIDEPDNNEILSEPFSVSGTCTNNVAVQIYNGLTYASSSVAFGQTVVCSTGVYSFYAGTLDTGFWNITASSSPNFVGIVVYNTGQSQLPIEDWPEEWLNEIATSSSPFDVLFRNWFGRKPYSYLSDFWAAFSGSVQNASSTQGWLTPTIEIESDYYSMNTTFLTPDTFTTIFSQDTWNSLRPVFELLIYIFFVTLWIGLFKKIV